MANLAAAVLGLWVASEPPPSVASDAPDRTNGPFTVAPGAWQLELGVDASFSGRAVPDGAVPLRVPTTLRVGLSPRVELRAFDGERLLHHDISRGVGGETSFGFKIRFNDPAPDAPRRPQFGVQPYFAFPLYGLRRHPDAVASGAALLWTQPVTRSLGVDINAGLELAFERGAAPLTGFVSASAQASIRERWLPYLELFHDIRGRGRAALELGADAGFVVVAHRRLAFNLAGRATFLAAVRSYGALAGVAFLLADGTRWRRPPSRR